MSLCSRCKHGTGKSHMTILYRRRQLGLPSVSTWTEIKRSATSGVVHDDELAEAIMQAVGLTSLQYFKRGAVRLVCQLDLQLPMANGTKYPLPKQ